MTTPADWEFDYTLDLAIEDAGTPVQNTGVLNFEGAGVTVSEAGGKTIITIPGGGSGGSAWDFDEGDQAVVYAVGTIDFEEGSP